MALSLKSPVFEPGSQIPARYTAVGENVSPPLHWSGAPADTHEYALICLDPDAPTPEPFVHWIIYGISANTSKLPEGLANDEELLLPVLARQGLNTMMKIGYTGPNPPFWHQAHRYHFKLYALNAPITLPVHAGRRGFFRAIEGHVIAEAELIGTFEKPVAARVQAAFRWAGVASVASVLVAAFMLQRRAG